MPNERTQLQIDFVAWLGELSAGVEVKNHCWLETEDGDANGGEFCPECVEKQARKNKREKGVKKADRFVHVRTDGGSAMEEDSQPFCEMCGAMLLCSLTRYAVGQELAWLDEQKPTTVEELGDNAASFHALMTGMGDWDNEKDWPRIEPHARRMLAAAGREIVEPGAVRFRPADAIGLGWREDSWYRGDSIWLGVYEWFALRLCEAFPDRSCREFLNNTSSINNYEFRELSHELAAFEHVKELLGHVGWPGGRGDFLRSLGFCSSGDLERPVLIADQRCARPKQFRELPRLSFQPFKNFIACFVFHCALESNATHSFTLHQIEQRPRRLPALLLGFFFQVNHLQRDQRAMKVESLIESPIGNFSGLAHGVVDPNSSRPFFRIAFCLEPLGCRLERTEHTSRASDFVRNASPEILQAIGPRPLTFDQWERWHGPFTRFVVASNANRAPSFFVADSENLIDHHALRDALLRNQPQDDATDDALDNLDLVFLRALATDDSLVAWVAVGTLFVMLADESRDRREAMTMVWLVRLFAAWPGPLVQYVVAESPSRGDVKRGYAVPNIGQRLEPFQMIVNRSRFLLRVGKNGMSDWRDKPFH